MTTSSMVTIDTIFAVGRAVVLVSAFAAFAWGFLRWRRAAERDTQRVFEQLDLVRADLLIMKEVMQSAAQRVDSAAKQVAHDVRLAPTQNGGTGRGYEIAARLARSGAPKEELIKSCGITTHEAELLVRLHGRPQQQQTAQSIAAPQSTARVAKSSATEGVANALADISRAIRKPQQAAPQPQAPAQSQRSPQVKSRLVAVG